MDITIGYLDEERIKLWAELNALKKALDEAVTKLSQTDKATVSSLQSMGQTLETKISAVKKIADEKTPEDVQTASRAAQDIVKIKTEMQALQKETEEYRERINAAKNALKRIQGFSDNSDVANKEIEGNRIKIAENTKTIDAYLAQTKEKNASIEDLVNKISSAATNSTERSQVIADLNAQASKDSSEISATKQQFRELQTALTELKEKQQGFFDTARESLENLSIGNKSRFDELYSSSQKRIAELEGYITTLLPGATSLSLSSSFENRKKAVEKNKGWWVVLLILSAIAIVAFGWWSLNKITEEKQPLSAVPIRVVIVAGLVIIEEFARRNYNVSSRLAEAYAYKEAVAKSYVGFKKELADIDLPNPSNGEVIKSVSVLAETFLQKIGDEPGKKVFDKERPAIGAVGAITKICGQDSLAPDKQQVLSNATHILSKISWPIVVLVAILAVTGCVIAWFSFRT